MYGKLSIVIGNNFFKLLKHLIKYLRILTILAIVLKRNPEINYKAVISVEGKNIICSSSLSKFCLLVSNAHQLGLTDRSSQQFCVNPHDLKNWN